MTPSIFGAANCGPVGLLLVALTAFPAASAEICVTCAGPDAHYRCAFEGDQSPAPDPRLALSCLGELSKSGGHQRCMIERNSQQPCKGPLRLLARPVDLEKGGANEAGAAPSPDEVVPRVHVDVHSGPATPQAVPNNSPEATLGKTKDAGKKDAQQAPEGPPKTVKEMVDQGTAKTGKSVEAAAKAAGDASQSAAEKTGNALSKAGSAISGAAKKTWNCISSLFGDC